MTYEEEFDKLCAPFLAAWGSAGPVEWPNVKLDPAPKQTDTWARFVVRRAPGSARQASLGPPGNRRTVRVGVIIIQLFCPSGIGGRSLRAIADVLVPAYALTQDGSIVYEVPTVSEIGTTKGSSSVNAGGGQPQELAGFYQINVEAPFKTWSLY